MPPSVSRSMAVAMGIAAAIIASPFARAADRIGNTEISRNIVQQISNGAQNTIQVGDDVFANEIVRTGTESSAKFVFSDSTNLALGPTSNVKLDRFVYSGDQSYAKAAVRFTTGAFRFTTGGSDKKAYELKTDTATIGVRGTIFDLYTTRTETIVTLVEGEIAVCPRNRFDGDPRTLTKVQLKKYHCLDLTAENQTARVTAREARSSSAPFSFAARFCTGGGGLCSATQLAAVPSQTPLMCYMKND